MGNDPFKLVSLMSRPIFHVARDIIHQLSFAYRNNFVVDVSCVCTFQEETSCCLPSAIQIVRQMFGV